MSRPEFVSNEDISRWSEIIDNDPSFPKDYSQQVILKEVCFAGIWLVEALQVTNCSDDDIQILQWNAGKLSFGRDPWEVHIKIYNDYLTSQFEKKNITLN